MSLSPPATPTATSSLIKHTVGNVNRRRQRVALFVGLVTWLFVYSYQTRDSANVVNLFSLCRQFVSKEEADIEHLEQKLEKIIKLCNVAVDSGKEYVKNQR